MFGGNPLFVCLGLNPTLVESNVCWLNLRFQRRSSYFYSNLGIQTLDESPTFADQIHLPFPHGGRHGTHGDQGHGSLLRTIDH